MPDTAAGSTFFHSIVQVVKRPVPHRDNAILLGQGDGLQLATYEEGCLLAPFLKAARLYNSLRAAGIPCLKDICGSMDSKLVHYVSLWMENSRKAADASAAQVH